MLTHTYLAVLGCIKDVHSTGFDAIGFDPSIQSKAALSAPAIPIWKRAIVPEGRQRQAQDENKHRHKDVTLRMVQSRLVHNCLFLFILTRPDGGEGRKTMQK